MTPGLDTVLRALADGRRREVLSVLHTHRSLELAALADELTIPPRPTSRNGPGDRTRRSLVIDLYHQHVPVLVGAELVAYDADTDRVELTALGDDVVEFVSRELASAIGYGGDDTE